MKIILESKTIRLVMYEASLIFPDHMLDQEGNILPGEYVDTGGMFDCKTITVEKKVS